MFPALENVFSKKSYFPKSLKTTCFNALHVSTKTFKQTDVRILNNKSIEHLLSLLLTTLNPSTIGVLEPSRFPLCTVTVTTSINETLCIKKLVRTIQATFLYDSKLNKAVIIEVDW